MFVPLFTSDGVKVEVKAVVEAKEEIVVSNLHVYWCFEAWTINTHLRVRIHV